MSLQAWHKHRKVIFLFGVIAAGGYVSYQVYRSQYISRKTKRFFGFLQSLSRLFEFLADGSDSVTLVGGDLNDFFLSDKEEIPQSLKQAFKILQCPEFQEGIASLSNSVLFGVMGGLQACKTPEFLYKIPKMKDKVTAIHEHDPGRTDNRGCQDGLLERLMDKLFSKRGKGFASAVVGCAARNLVLSFFEAMKGCNKIEHERNLTSKGSDCELHTPVPVCEAQQERDKRHYVLLSTDYYQNSRNSDKYSSKSVENSGNRSITLESLLDFASGCRGKSLIVECIEAFVTTAVSVYLDKTKEVNVYDELVTGLTKPSHQAPIKDLLRSVCSGAVETLVRTSHEVLSRGSGYDDYGQGFWKHEQKQKEIPLKNLEQASLGRAKSTLGSGEGSSRRRFGSTTFVLKKDDCNIKSITLLSEDLDSLLNSQRASGSVSPSSCNTPGVAEKEDIKARWLSQLQNSRIVVAGQRDGLNGFSLNLINGLSKALAIPNNRKLVIDVAGAMTSEAVRSFFDVILAFIKPVHGGLPAMQGKAGTSGLQELCYLHWDKVRLLAKSITANALVIATLWLAVVMHVMSGVLESA